MVDLEPAEQVSIRAVRPDDRERIVRAFQNLDRSSVYSRFFSWKKELSDEELRRVTECDGVNEVVLVATAGSGDRETIVALAGYVRRSATADLHFVVEEDFQGRGIARRLLRELVDTARANGTVRFQADVLAENTRMLAVLRNSGLHMRTSHDQGIVHATLSLCEHDRISTFP